MDKATVIGMVMAFGLILAAIVIGPQPLGFIDIKSALIVFGGSAGAMAIAFPWSSLVTGLKAVKNAFTFRTYDAEGTVTLLSELSNRARREGLLSLEDAANEAEDDFLRRGLLLMADGHEASTIESVLWDELAKIEGRHKRSIAVWVNIGDMGPAMGMIGTLVGLVQMLFVMGDDPGGIGPAMAVALLTTLYGSLMANVVGIPLANKLTARSAEEIAHKELITAGLLSILAGENPRFMVERLNATLPPDQRVEDTAA